MENGRQLVILGATSNGDLFELIDACNEARPGDRFVPVAFLDDNPEINGRLIRGLPIRGPLECARDFPKAWFLNAIGAPTAVARRAEILARANVSPERFATFVHPRAIVSPSARIGHGCLVFAGAVIGAGARLGNFGDVMPNAVLSHGCSVEDYSFVASGAMIGGDVKIGEACFLGLNCSVREGVAVGPRSLIGQGSVVLKDVPDGSVMVGNPARKIRDLFPL